MIKLSLDKNNLLFYFSFILLVLPCCNSNDTENTVIGQLKQQVGYLNYSSGSISTIQYKKDHVINEIVICSPIPDSLKKSTKILFDGDLIQFSDPLFKACVKNLVAIDLCNNPQLSPGFTKTLYPLCFTPSIPELLLRSNTELNNATNLYSFTLLSPINFTTHDMVSFSAGIGTLDWEVDVQYSCDVNTSSCTLTHKIQEWGNERIYSTGSFVYAIPKIPDGFTIKIVKENASMN